MKFKVRDGFVCRLSTTVEVGNGQTETHVNLAYPGQVIDLQPAQADWHLHQIEALDDEARGWHNTKVLVVPETPMSASISPELLQALTLKITQVSQQLMRDLPATISTRPAT